jgi:gluconokinase
MVIIVTGVAGSGKTTIGRSLAEELGWKFYDADDFHPRSNVEKMSRCIPLDDADRLPWLMILRDLIRGTLDRGEGMVLACSALKGSYREFLQVDGRVKLAYLKVDPALILERLRARRGHFMKPEMLHSQLAALEEPEPASHFETTMLPGEIVREMRLRLAV